MSIRVYDPTSEDVIPAYASAPRLPTLAGRTIGLLDNSKIRVRELLNFMEEMLRTQYGVTEVRRFRKSDPSRPAPAEILAAMQGCAAIISAVGD